MTETVRAWHPEVPGVAEVLHATFAQHAYPAHVHDDWTVLLIDDGAVAYELDRHGHHATPAAVTLLPPLVPHDGRSAVEGTPFRKRVLYLARDWLPASAADAAVADPVLRDPRALAIVAGIHDALAHPADVMAAECGVLALREAAGAQYGGTASAARAVRDAPLARRLRRMLDERLLETFTIEEAARLLGAHPSHLVRVFSQAYGIAPHRYVTGRRVDRARRLLLAGRSPAEAAAASGFHDQAHLTRHFRRVLGTTPGAFAA
ncbi:AraC family transcriptional regulator [Protaetiibacter sp. SSC-01]|uniref:helix-turn-helix transcriptional regulator n=1 Tax=Protaetiibacter sp. SSC-01 TaxID=2759943 RepID=UPI0016571A8A|nr:AraC family transcriptional regulator [Protaetiibacter sp. SSC-01]QNO37704.1 AraC family transcriptional regulator [Protaetiibacter sp. SSC-01]